MGPPISTWPCDGQVTDNLVNSDYRRSVLLQFVDSFRVICVNLTFVIVFVQIMLSLQFVRAGPVVFNMEYSQGPVPLARNIRHLPCISRRTGQEGMCMFAIDCLKANGTHLGTCIDRFYFGSCCQIPDKTILPQIIGNHIDDNSIDEANFVHPQTEDKPNPVKIPASIFPVRKTTTEKIETTKVTETIGLETKSDEQTTIDNKIFDDEKLTTAVETTAKLEKVEVTELPIKLSTFQTVSGESSSTVTEKLETTAAKIPEISTSTTSTSPSIITSSSTPTSTVSLRPKPTRKPTRPSSFTRPTYKPYNITRPQYTQSTFKPKPTKPALNTTRKPPYRLPPKRPSTKKPLPLPPRLNITILPQSTSSKPLFTRPQLVSITYINTTQVTANDEPKDEPTTSITTTPSTTTTEKVITTDKDVTTEKVVETSELTETTILTTEAVTEKFERITTEPAIETTESLKETTFEENITETVRPVTQADIPEPEVTTTSTEYPPFATWSSNTDSVTKTPEKITEAPTTTTEETWSPITPPEGWILLSTIAPKPETTVSTSSKAPTTEAAIETQETTLQVTETTERPESMETTAAETTTTPTTIKVTTTPTNIKVTTPPTTKLTTTSSTTEIQTESTTKITSTTTEKATTSLTSIKVTTPPTTKITTTSSTAAPVTTSSTTLETTAKVTEKVPVTTQAIQEFTVNVTLSPTVPTTTDASLTFTLLSTTNETKANESSSSTTESGSSAAIETSTNATVTVETTTEAVNMSDFKNVCGRRLWQAPTGRIVGGAKSGFGMWPWQISLRQYRTSTYLHKCGAALLNENWAITAAHCVEHVPPSELLVRLGEHDLANEDEPYGFAERRVQIVASHPHFDPATFEYDLALLRFYEPVTFQPNILPVCVPDDDDDYVGKTAYVTGWGRLFDEGPLPSVLQEVKVPVINNTACEAMYQTAGYNEHIPNIFICAGRSKGGTDSCEGDSGGPMVLPRERDGRYVLGGVISWGIGCAEPNQPGVYTRISEFRDWINQILQF